MITIYQLTAAGVASVATTGTEREARETLRRFDTPAVAFDGLLAIAATGHTSTADLRAITSAAIAATGAHASDYGTPSCVIAGCDRPRGRVSLRTPEHLELFCLIHRRRVCASSSVDASCPASVAEYVTRLEARHAC